MTEKHTNRLPQGRRAALLSDVRPLLLFATLGVLVRPSAATFFTDLAEQTIVERPVHGENKTFYRFATYLNGFPEWPTHDCLQALKIPKRNFIKDNKIDVKCISRTDNLMNRQFVSTVTQKMPNMMTTRPPLKYQLFWLMRPSKSGKKIEKERNANDKMIVKREKP